MQRSFVTVRTIEYAKMIYLEDLIDIVRSVGVSPYPLIKRPDEAYLASQTWDNAYFVEDLAAAVAEKLPELDPAAWYVSVRNEESIHQHDAVACVTSPQWKLFDTFLFL